VGALDLDLTIADNWDVEGYIGGSCHGYDEYEGIMAPGTHVTTTDLGNTYYTGAGTSFSCPLVAGICALLLQIQPDLNATEVKHILYATAIDLGDSGWDSVYGWGLVDAVAAVEYTIMNY
jgi:subtilisin family serine protease